MNLLNLLVALLFFAVLLYILYVFVTDYMATDKTQPKRMRILTATRESLTILWAKFVMLVGSFVGSIGDIGDYLGQPEIRGYAETALGNPKIVAGILLGVGFIAIKARTRGGSLAPVAASVNS